MLLKLVPANLDHLCDVIDQFGAAWIHGDGNVYVDEADSNFHFKYSNPMHNQAPSAAMYRAKFTDSDDVPDTCKELEELMMQNAKRDMEKSQETKNANEPKVVRSKKRTLVAPQANPLLEKEEYLKEVAATLSDKEEQLHAAAKNVAGRTKELSEKEAELADRETKLREMEAKLAALQQPTTVVEKTNPAVPNKPAANK